MEDEVLLGLVPHGVKLTLEKLWLRAQAEIVNGGESTSAAIEQLEEYQKALEAV